MRAIRVYVDNSVFGGAHDAEFQIETRRFFDQVRQGLFVVIVSDLVMQELAPAPEPVRQVLASLPGDAVVEVSTEAEAQALANAYVQAGVLGAASHTDALHVALATVAGVDLLLSWNFRHIVNFNRIRGFNSVNVRLGYRTLTILSPLEVGYENTIEEEV